MLMTLLELPGHLCLRVRVSWVRACADQYIAEAAATESLARVYESSDVVDAARAEVDRSGLTHQPCDGGRRAIPAAALARDPPDAINRSPPLMEVTTTDLTNRSIN